MNPWCTPQRILLSHAADELPQFRAHRGSTTLPFRPALPAPEDAEPLAMPLDHCGGFHNEADFFPARPSPVKQNPESTIGDIHLGPSPIAQKDRILLSERKALEQQIPGSIRILTQTRDHPQEGQTKKPEHGSRMP